jgi:hypothetical protein
MRRGLIFLVLVCLVGFVSASVTVHNSSFKTVYFPYEGISGSINLTINGENFISYITSNNGGSVSLEDFLVDNGADYSCDPFDCSNDYDISGGSKDELFSKGNGEIIYAGFVLEGSDVEVTKLNFSMLSDFQESTSRPITMKFFEDIEWKFNEFSDSFGARSFGCYDNASRALGPLIRTSAYCEVISLSETGSVFAGALVDSADTADLMIALYSTEGGSSLGECEFTPATEEGCRIDAEEGDAFPTGEYHVCVEAADPTNYHIYDDTSGDSCGFVYATGPNNSTKDYAIFASGAKYANYTHFSSKMFDFEELTLAADNLLATRYNRNCTNKCVLPIEINGISQDFRIYNVTLDYIREGEDKVEYNVYPLEIIPAKVDFSGVLDLGLTGFNVSKSGKYTLSIGENKVLDKNIEILPAPIIKSLSPVNPPAGVPVIFFVLTDQRNKSLTYKWSFGEGVNQETTTPYVIHTYTEIKNYSMIVEASAGGNLTSKKGFIVGTTSPKDSINSSIQMRKNSINDLISEINTYPSWYQERMKKLVNLSYYQTELTRIEKARDNANYDADYLKVAIELYALDVPISVYVSDYMETPLLNENININPSIIADFAGGGDEEDFEAYKSAILKWQTENIESNIRSDVLSVVYFSGLTETLMRVYSVSVTSHSEDPETYIVINKPLSDTYFKEDPGARKINSSSIVVLEGIGKKSFEFYYFDNTDETSFFVSPKLTRLVLEENVDMTCNQNKVCEKENGENTENCRTDCKPTGRMVIYIILVILFGVGLYSLVQLWYKRRYESYLFENRRDLYNLTMYVINARARGFEDNKISHDLKKQGWASERVEYAIKKSRGQSMGLPEIIPFSKIKAYIRANRARNAIVTASKQQMGRNINKSSFQRRV